MNFHDLLRKLNDQPFKPFRLKLSNATSIDVFEPGTCIVGETSAVLPVETAIDIDGYRYARNWKTISISHLVEFTDLNSNENGSKRKRKPI